MACTTSSTSQFKPFITFCITSPGFLGLVKNFIVLTSPTSESIMKSVKVPPISIATLHFTLHTHDISIKVFRGTYITSISYIGFPLYSIDVQSIDIFTRFLPPSSLTEIVLITFSIWSITCGCSST
ncbi:hypothetical protein YG5714_3051 [Sulfolobus islandicus Y.G.57.14]|uniref:Uncharacterized protein n=1 Tax=Saccharolobus islandicus (strain Y.G.57.14 / Yellowstone \|nr:hypothetical protein YG5714_3051 [Sulfolobus islandicus Y.G.57.14]